MKTMTCKQLGGACDEAFSANTFDEIVNMSKNHGMKMFKQKDKRHLDAMEKISLLIPLRLLQQQHHQGELYQQREDYQNQKGFQQ